MQEIKYAEVAWNDIKHSDGWLKKVFLLALLQFVPIFGQIVLFGYIYGWARDIAWGVHAPLPAKIFGNEDGKLYSRGFFIFVLMLVFMLVPALVMSIFSVPFAALGNFSDSNFMSAAVFSMFGATGLISLILTVCCLVFWAVGAMRITIYNRIGPGFQLKKLWAMLRYDTNGALRILGMAALILFIGGIVATAVAALLSLLVFGLSVPGLIGLGSGYGNPGFHEVFGAIGPSLGIWFVLMLAVSFFAEALVVLVYLMVARASGYWTQQFQVAQWRGQDDPMPFELVQMQQQQQYQPYPPAGTGV